MPKSYRIQTEVGVDKNIQVQIDQEFDELEILSLKIRQSDVYSKDCSQYGVVTGRVLANGGFGIPNARVSIFIPLSDEDQLNPVLSTLYPYKNFSDLNEDGYRYNLLPYVQSHSGHNPTGTFPDRTDVLFDESVIEVFDKYYKFTVKTNSSGDYMILGVPVGTHTLVLDLDLSDIGEFSLSPQDLIRMGVATESQVSGTRFKSSENLNSLPQIVNLNKALDVAPLWGQPETCQIAISRVDFDLREEANIDIQPTAIFMGSMISSPDDTKLSTYCNPKNRLGNLCELITGPGEIIGLRQTIFQGDDGYPLLEVADLPNNGNLIDEDGVFMFDLPMNLDYVVTNEFGERIFSDNPEIGIPTSAKYRFKLKWKQPNTLNVDVKRPYVLVPNIREYGWNSTGSAANSTDIEKSYAFSLDWSAYTSPDAAVNCEDTFYKFQYNKVYTVSQFIDNLSGEEDNPYLFISNIFGRRERFVGIKEITSRDCKSTNNEFPTNDAVRNFNLQFFIVSILFQILQIVMLPLIFIYHVISFLWNSFLIPTAIILLVLAGFQVAGEISAASAAIASSALGGWGNFLLALPFAAKATAWSAFGIGFAVLATKLYGTKFPPIRLPMITYPDCEACDCGTSEGESNGSANFGSSSLVQTSGSIYKTENITFPYNGNDWAADPDDNDYGTKIGLYQAGIVSILGGLSYPKERTRMPGIGDKVDGKRFWSDELTLSERINKFNLKQNYFNNGSNRVKIYIEPNVSSNSGKYHFDNTLTIFSQPGITYSPGDLITFVNTSNSQDINVLSGVTNELQTNSITGTSQTLTQVTVPWCYMYDYFLPQSTTYNFTGNTTASTIYHQYPTDIEYCQVITAITVSEARTIRQNSGGSVALTSFWDVINGGMNIRNENNTNADKKFVAFPNVIDGFDDQVILILQRGVDPYSPLFETKVGIGKLLGKTNEDVIQVTANLRLNVPVQALPNTSTFSLTRHNIGTNNVSTTGYLFHPSYFYEPGTGYSAYTTSATTLYSRMDGSAGTFSPFPSSQKPLSQVSNISANRVKSNTSDNDLYTTTSTQRLYKYISSDILDGGSYMYFDRDGWGTTKFDRDAYYSPVYNAITDTINMSDKTRVIMRSDRLPTSDKKETVGGNSYVLQQNLNFAIYNVTNPQELNVGFNGYSTGASLGGDGISDNDFLGTNVLNSYSCENMVSLDCYSGDGYNFGVIENCDGDYVQNGCYVLVTRPFVSLFKDFGYVNEWGYRFRFFYGICQGVISDVFSNNWVNGTVYTFPIQIDNYYNGNPFSPNFNQPISEYCQKAVYFHSPTNNFYLRSTPYYSGATQSLSKFVGASPLTGAYNQREILFPTTIMDLGPRDFYLKELIGSPSYNGYAVSGLTTTSYGDLSDILNVFLLTRITNTGFLSQLFSAGNASINGLFDQRKNSFNNAYGRIDGDYAQLSSINSQVGVIKFNKNYYGTGNQIIVAGNNNDNVMLGIFFSSSTYDIQLMDNFSPGRNIIDIANVQVLDTYGFNSQDVPMFQWNIQSNTSFNTIFGSQRNSWATSRTDIYSSKYQGLDRISSNYFQNGNRSTTYNIRGYIFAQDQNGDLTTSTQGITQGKKVVGAPWHFYFGLQRGASAFDKFAKIYITDPNEL